jgi:hypothetical protein
MNTTSYPVALTIDYPDRELNRLTSFFRPILAIPIVIILSLVSGGWSQYYVGGGGVLFVATILMLLFSRKYPRWWFDWNLALVKFSTRVSAYLCLMRDEYPSTDDDQFVHIDISYPDAKQLSQGLPLVKWLLAIPHYIVLALLSVAVILSVIIAWFAILFTGHYPRGLFNFIVGVFRWNIRVSAYAFLLVTDEYPPFSLD